MKKQTVSNSFFERNKEIEGVDISDIIRKSGSDTSGASFIDIALYDRVCILDVLGFKKMVLDENKCVKSENISNLPIFIKLDILSQLIKSYIDENIKSKIKVIMISDAIFIFFNSSFDEKVGDLIALIYVYGYMNGLLYRGAISNKSIIGSKSEDGIFIGPGVIDAYLLENKISNYSRIVISPSINDFEFSENDLDDDIRIFNVLKYIKKYYELIYDKYTTFIGNKKYKELEVCSKCEMNSNGDCYKEIINDSKVETFSSFCEIIRENITESYTEKKSDAISDTKEIKIKSRNYMLLKKIDCLTKGEL